MDTETKKYIKRMGIFTLILVIIITCIIFLVKTINVLNEKIFNVYIFSSLYNNQIHCRLFGRDKKGRQSRKKN